MEKVLLFKVSIDDLEEKIWRKIEILDDSTVADLAYAILASFDSLAYHLYEINHNGIVYSCGEPNRDLLSFTDGEYKNATLVKLNDLDFNDKNMFMDYDFGSTTTFRIEYLSSSSLMESKENYPLVIEGQGKGMLDDMSDFELKDIVDETDRLGKSEFYYTPGYDRDDYFDYREYDIVKDNSKLKEIFSKIKNGYEKKDS